MDEAQLLSLQLVLHFLLLLCLFLLCGFISSRLIHSFLLCLLFAYCQIFLLFLRDHHHVSDAVSICHEVCSGYLSFLLHVSERLLLLFFFQEFSSAANILQAVSQVSLSLHQEERHFSAELSLCRIELLFSLVSFTADQRCGFCPSVSSFCLERWFFLS